MNRVHGITPTVTARRLTKLADFLDGLPRERFNYMYWVSPDWEKDPRFSCGSAACALGWATTMPEFRRLGLHMDPNTNSPFNEVRKAWDSYQAASVTFGLTDEEAYFVFSPRYSYGDRVAPDYHATPHEVAEHIRAFVRDREALARAELSRPFRVP